MEEASAPRTAKTNCNDNVIFFRQRHFSLEDYNDLVMESSNSNASIDNSIDDNNMMINGGSNDPPTSTITSFANLGKFFSNFNSSPLSRRNSFSTANHGGGVKCSNNDSMKPFIGKLKTLF